MTFDPRLNALVGLGIFDHSLSAKPGQVSGHFADRSAQTGGQPHQEGIEDAAHREHNCHAGSRNDDRGIRHEHDQKDARVAVGSEILDMVPDAEDKSGYADDNQQGQQP